MNKKILFYIPLLLVVLYVVSCAPVRVNTKGVENAGVLAIYCDPADALVYVDDVLQGEAKQFDGRPGFLELASGPHKVRIEKDGYQSYRTEVYMSKATEEIKIKLRKK